MNGKNKIRIAICGRILAIALLAGMLQPQPPMANTQAATQHKREPLCEQIRAGGEIPPPAAQTPLVAAISPETGTQTPPLSTTSPELQIEPTPIPETPPTRQPSPPVQAVPAPTPSAEPKMGDTRTLDGQKQVYFLGFGWIEDNDTPNECVYAEDMYENGNKVGDMGGGEVGRSCGDINKMVGSMD